MSFTTTSSTTTTTYKVAKSKASLDWCADRRDSHSPSSSPNRAHNQVTASSPCLAMRDMHLGEFLFLPEQDQIPDKSCIKHERRNPGMFGHPVVIVGINHSMGIVTYRSVTSVKKRTDRIQQGINGRDRMITRVCIKRRGYDNNPYGEYNNEHQLEESYYLHEDSMNFKKPSEVLITAGLDFKIEPATLKRLDWAKGSRVYLDIESAKRLAGECPIVRGPAYSPRRGSSSSDEGRSSSSSSPSPSPLPRLRGALMERSANITTPSTRAKVDLMKRDWRPKV